MPEEKAGHLKITIEFEINPELMEVMKESIAKMPEVMRGQMGKMFRGSHEKEGE